MYATTSAASAASGRRPYRNHTGSSGTASSPSGSACATTSLRSFSSCGEVSTASSAVFPSVSSVGVLIVDAEQTLADRVDHRLHPRVEVELLEDVANVVLDRVLRDVQLLADLP